MSNERAAMCEFSPKPLDLRAADATASELIRLWNAGEQFFGEQMKREIIGLAVTYDSLRAGGAGE